MRSTAHRRSSRGSASSSSAIVALVKYRVSRSTLTTSLMRCDRRLPSLALPPLWTSSTTYGPSFTSTALGCNLGLSTTEPFFSKTRSPALNSSFTSCERSIFFNECSELRRRACAVASHTTPICASIASMYSGSSAGSFRGVPEKASMGRLGCRPNTT